jgi:roadblock/LC7 domain-containing protein
MMIFNAELVQVLLTSGFLTLQDTNDLYRSVAAILGERVLFNSTLASVARNKAGVTVKVCQRGRGSTTIKAKKLLMTGSPVLNNLMGWDLSPKEVELFAKFRGYGYFAGAVINKDLPSHRGVTNVANSNGSFHIPQLPAVFTITATRFADDTHLVTYTTDPDMDHAVAAQMCLAYIDNLVRNMGGSAKTELLAWYPHGPFHIQVRHGAWSCGLLSRY